jgi:hypothetical protein
MVGIGLNIDGGQIIYIAINFMSIFIFRRSLVPGDELKLNSIKLKKC